MGVRRRPSRDGSEANRGYAQAAKVLCGLIAAVAALSLGAASNAAAAATGQIAGTVKDASTHNPIEGIEVCAYLESGGVGAGETEGMGCATTGAGGEYVIPELANGSYAVEFSIGGGELNYVTQYYDGVSSPSEAKPVTVSAPSTTGGIDAELKEGGRIAGRVTDALTNEAITGVLVAVFEAGGKSSLAAIGITKAGGEYTIAGLPAGEYQVRFLGGRGHVSQYYNGKSAQSEASVVTVAAGQTTGGIDAALQPMLAPAAPVDITPPTVSGPLAVGSVLNCSNGLWTGNPAPAFTYVWLRDGSPVAGATESGYKVQGADEGHSLSCEVTAQNSVARRSVTSAAAAIPGPPHGPAKPKPRVAATSTKITVSGRWASVHIRCSDAACKGSIELTAEVVSRESGGGRSVVRRRTVVLAEGSFSLAADKSGVVRLRLTAAGTTRLAHAGRHALAATLRVSVRGGKTVSESVSVR
jgi:hypothetical protein